MALLPADLLPYGLHENEVLRFAPSPTGPLHLGHGFSALFAWDLAQRTGGTFLLRIEDTDTTRSRPEWETAIHADMAALGITYAAPWRQSERLGVYTAALEKLKTRGLLYPCFCTRADIKREYAGIVSAPHGPDGPLYPGICKGLHTAEAEDKIAAGEVPSWRLDSAKAAAQLPPLTACEHTTRETRNLTIDPQMAGDFVLARKDIGTSYHLACVVDDAAQAVTLVTRGADMHGAIHVQRTLQALLGLPPVRYAHHPLVVDSTGRRLAKRAADSGLSELIKTCGSAEAVMALALSCLG